MPLQRTGNQAVDDKFTVIAYGNEMQQLPGLALDATEQNRKNDLIALQVGDERYAIFLEVLDRELGAWLDEVEESLGSLDPDGSVGGAEAVARVVAATLSRRPLLCELISGMAGVLERNIPVDFARVVKVKPGEDQAALMEFFRGPDKESFE